jgi:hypothetical protein
MGFKWCLDPIVVFFFEIKNFSFPVLADPIVVNFFEMHLIQHLYFFLEMKKISFSKKLQVWDQSTN